ncbi:MAG TPA: response regulator [Terriglobales bacterium]|jgi:response regulator RpfG family c-di-GMP phosphodiesterase
MTTAVTAPANVPDVNVLFVDDEPLVLEAVKRGLRREFNIHVARNGEEGLERLTEDGPYAVIVSDMRMPGMDGAQFLARVRSVSPDSIRVLLTGFSDMPAATRAVNEGRIYRFLSKPATTEELRQILRECMAQYCVAKNEKDLLEKTLTGAVSVLSEVLNLTTPLAFNKGVRVRQYVKHMAERLQLEGAWQYEIAALLSELGCVTLTPDILEAVYAGQKLDSQDQERYDKRRIVGRDLLARIPRLELVAEMILNQEEPHSKPKASQSPDEEIILNGTQMLKIAMEFDSLLNGGTGRDEALRILRSHPKGYGVRFLHALADVETVKDPTELRLVDVRDIRPGMVLKEDLRSVTGILVAANGHAATQAFVNTIHNFAEKGSVKGKIRVLVGTKPC